MSGETFGSAADFFAAEAQRGGGRKLDEKATRIARARQERGVEKLNAAFGVAVERDEEGNALPPPRNVMAVLIAAHETGDPSGSGRPVRLHPNTPPVRDPEHARKHRLRKRAHESRRRNRGA